MPSKLTPLAELLKSRREAAGYSRLRASQLSGVNMSTIEAWEIGRVSKPPIHDVLRLARVLKIATRELERAVLAEPIGDGDQKPVARSGAAEASAGVALLHRAEALMEWSDHDVAAALNTNPERVRELHDGDGELSVLEVMSLIAVLAAYPAGRGGASEDEVSELLAQLRGSRT